MDLNLIGLIRVSTVEQAREGKAGIDRQYADIERIRQNTGANIVRVVEVIESGNRVVGREEYEQIARDLALPNIHGVACSALDRLVRADNFSDFSVFQPFKDHGKRIFTPGNIVEPNSQAGFMESIINGLFAGIEKQKIKERTMGGKERNRRKGRSVVGQQCLPRGVLYDKATETWSYDLDPDCPKPRPRKAKAGDALLIKRAFELLVYENASYANIAETIGGGMAPETIPLTLKNPIWIGIRRYELEMAGPVLISEITNEPYRKTKMKDEPWEIRVIDAPLVAPEMFWEAQRIIDRRREEFGLRKRPPTDFLLGGLLRCGCGCAMYHRLAEITLAGKHRAYYYCSSKHRKHGVAYCGRLPYRREFVERAVRDVMIPRLLDPELLTRVLKIHQRIQPQTDRGRARKVEASKLESQREELIDLKVSGLITKREFETRARKLDEAMRALDVLYPESAPIRPDGVKRIVEGIVMAFADFARLTFQDQRALLQRAVRRIMISGSGVIESLTLSGGFLSQMETRVNLRISSCASPEFNPLADVVLRFPKPIQIMGVAA